MTGPSESAYSAFQIEQFYERISLPPRHRHAPGSQSAAIANGADSIAYLTALQRYTIAAIPFENLELHYSPQHAISLDPAHLFSKIVLKVDASGRSAGRGGYCMENNCLFAEVLKGLGFVVMSTGARVNASVAGGPPSQWGGWTHMINIISTPSSRYLVDVGFGAGGPTAPIRLCEGDVMLNAPPEQESRLSLRTTSTTSALDPPMWIYEKRNTRSDDFIPCYCFREVEFLAPDFEMMSHYTSTSPRIWFTRLPVCVKYILQKHGESIVGYVSLFGQHLKKVVDGEQVVDLILKNEEDRLRALAMHFELFLEPVEARGILGMVSEIK